MMLEPRAWQEKAHQTAREGAKKGHKAQLLMAPTGAGKTFSALRAVKECLDKNRTAMFICDRLTLIKQTSKVADSLGLDHGIIQASNPREDKTKPFQIASIQTLERRSWPQDIDLVICDETHSVYKTWKDQIIKKDSFWLGLSATPFTKGLGNLYSNLINVTTMDELTRDGILVPMRVFSCRKINMQGAETANGEWTDKAVEDRGREIIGDVVTEWLKIAEGRKTFVFGSTIKHCEEMARQFNEVGVYARVFSAYTKEDERNEIWKELDEGELKVIISVEALAKGVDYPGVSVIVDCRPLRKSFSTFIQMIGRGLRSAPDKADMILMDHSGNVVRFADDFSDLYFNGLKSLNDAERKDQIIRKEPKEKEEYSCPSCGITPFKHICVCGYATQSQSNIIVLPGKMVEQVMLGKRKLADSRYDLWKQLVTYSLKHSPDKAEKRAKALYYNIVKSWPDFDFHSTPQESLSPEVINQIKYINIRYAKGRKHI
ncbi:MAG: DEAD/DEAH box helicase family protein [Chlamydiales bacterium]|nr:DEAD/DEAH box helicase family protein [Chlamydiales bacterium]